jgi:hypothetical protein
VTGQKTAQPSERACGAADLRHIICSRALRQSDLELLSNFTPWEPRDISKSYDCILMLLLRTSLCTSSRHAHRHNRRPALSSADHTSPHCQTQALADRPVATTVPSNPVSWARSVAKSKRRRQRPAVACQIPGVLQPKHHSYSRSCEAFPMHSDTSGRLRGGGIGPSGRKSHYSRSSMERRR